MILSRIVHQLRTQDWTAIALELLILILGVAIGFQVSTWREDVVARADESAILQRLHSEVTSVIESRAPIRAYRQRTYDMALSALYALNDIGGLDELTEESCRGISGSHIYSAPPSDIPIVEEILVTGRLDRIRNEELRAAIISFLQQKATTENTMHSVNLDAYRLAHEYPDLVQRHVRKGSGNENERPVTSVRICDYGAMKASRGFMNDLSDNLGRYSAYLKAVFEDMDDRLARLHAVLDAELGLTHPGQAAPWLRPATTTND